MTQAPSDPPVLFQLSHIGLPDGFIEIFGAARPDSDETQMESWTLRMELCQPETGLHIAIEHTGFVFDFMRQAAAYDPTLVTPNTFGVVHGTADYSMIADVNLSGMLFGLVSKGGHLLMALNDMHGDRRVVYLAPTCYAPNVLRQMLFFHPLQAFGVPTPYPSGALYDPDRVATLEGLCEIIHRSRLGGNNPEEVYSPAQELTGDLAQYLQRLLFHELLLGGPLRRHLHEATELVRRST